MPQDRWAVSLRGKPLDLEDAAELLAGEGPLRVNTVVDVAGHTWTALFADAFSNATSASEVNDAAPSIVDRLNGVLFVRHPNREPLSVDAVLEWREAAAGSSVGFTRSVFISAQDELTVRSRLKAGLTVTSNEGQSIYTPPPERAWLITALSDDVLADVLMFLRGSPDWFDLWKAFEMMTKDISDRSGGKWKSSGVPWPDVVWFSKCANFHRHSRAKSFEGVNAQNAMKIGVARRFVAGLVKPWCEWRQAQAASGLPGGHCLP
jgi:hypothetical protein